MNSHRGVHRELRLCLQATNALVNNSLWSPKLSSTPFSIQNCNEVHQFIHQMYHNDCEINPEGPNIDFEQRKDYFIKTLKLLLK